MSQNAAHLTVAASISSIALISLFIIPFLNNVSAQEENPNFFAAKSSPYGTPFQEWTQKWWQWYLNYLY